MRNNNHQKNKNHPGSKKKHYRHRSPTQQKKNKKPTNKISDHFSKKDFICQDSGKFKISLGLVGALEELRAKTKKRITIIKGFECPDVAEKKGQIKRNLHVKGLAADIKIEGMTPIEIIKSAETIESITGIGLNIENDYVHIDTRKSERAIWVEKNDDEIPITEDNRKQYFDK